MNDKPTTNSKPIEVNTNDMASTHASFEAKLKSIRAIKAQADERYRAEMDARNAAERAAAHDLDDEEYAEMVDSSVSDRLQTRLSRVVSDAMPFGITEDQIIEAVQSAFEYRRALSVEKTAKDREDVIYRRGVENTFFDER